MSSAREISPSTTARSSHSRARLRRNRTPMTRVTRHRPRASYAAERLANRRGASSELRCDPRDDLAVHVARLNTKQPTDRWVEVYEPRGRADRPRLIPRSQERVEPIRTMVTGPEG